MVDRHPSPEVAREPTSSRARLTIDDVVDRIAAVIGEVRSPRRLVGIVGPPGAGKSSIAGALASAFDPPLVVVSMDGFHLPNAELDRLGRRARKGAPDTFDASGFVDLLLRLRATPVAPVVAPSFDREIDEPIPDGTAVGVDDRVVIVEGNYLLLEEAPWNAIRPLLDLAVYVDLDDDERRRRLIARHVEFGKAEDDARRFVEVSDERNAQRISATRHRADASIAGPT